MSCTIIERRNKGVSLFIVTTFSLVSRGLSDICGPNFTCSDAPTDAPTTRSSTSPPATEDLLGDILNTTYPGSSWEHRSKHCKDGEIWEALTNTCRPDVWDGSHSTLLSNIYLPKRAGSLERHCFNSSYIYVKECSVPWALRNGTYNATKGNTTHVCAKDSQGKARAYRILCYSAKINDGGKHDPIVCLYESISPSHNKNVVFSLEMICLSLDLISCVVYAITFILYKGIRNVFGQLVINLIFLIALGDLSYVISQRLPEENMGTEGFCQFLAIATHYLYLARFAWMTILSIDIAKTFYLASQLLPAPDRKKSRNFLIICIILGYLIPAVLTTVTVTVNYTVDSSIMYGRTIFGNCWMGTQLSILLSFVLPIAFTLFTNILLSIYSIVTLFRIRRVGVQRSKEFQRLAADCKVVFGICSLLGVTWIFGFLALIPVQNNSSYDSNSSPMSWAYYPFVLLSTTQATVICLVFLVKKEVFDFYSQLTGRIKSSVLCTCRKGSRTTRLNIRSGKQSADQILVADKNLGLVLTSPNVTPSPINSPV